MGVLSAAFTAISGFFAKTVVGKFLGQALLSFGLSALSMALQKKPSFNTGGITGDSTMAGEKTPQSIILGYTATGGTLLAPAYTYDYNGSSDAKYLTYMIALSDFPITDITALIIEGKEYGFHPTKENKLGRSLAGDMDGRVWVRFHDGTQTEADQDMVDILGSYPLRPWTNEFVLKGVAYAAVTFVFDRDVFSGAPEVRFVVKGAPLYDPRKDTSVGGSGSHRWADQSTWEYSDNLAIAAYNLLRGIRMEDGSVYGMGADASALPLGKFFNAMNVCDEAGTQPEGSFAQDTKRYRFGLQFSVDEEPNAVIDAILAAGMGRVSEYGGYYSISIGPIAAAPAVMAITDDDIIVSASREYSPFVGQNATYNGITASFPDPASLFESREAAPIHMAEWEIKDGKRLVADLKLTACPFDRQVRRVMREALANNRRERNHIITLPPAYMKLIPLETISWTSEHNGYSNKIFEITDKQIDSETLAVVLYLRESDPSDYSFDAVSDSVRPIISPVDPVVIDVVGVDNITASPILIRNDNGNGKRVAIRIGWNAAAVYDSLTYEIKNQFGDIVEYGSVPDIKSGFIVVAGGVLPSSTYNVRLLAHIASRSNEWSSSVSVITPSALLDFEDFAPDLEETLNDAILAGQVADAAANAAASSAGAAQNFMIAANGFMIAANTFAVAANSFRNQAQTHMLAANVASIAANTARNEAQAFSITAGNSASAAAGSAATSQAFSNTAGNHAAAAAANSISAAASANSAAGSAANSANSAAASLSSSAAAAASANASAQSATVAQGHSVAANTARAGAVTASNTAVAAASNASSSSASAANSASLAISARDTAQGHAGAAANSATAAAVSANASAQSATVAQSHMISANTARVSAQTASQQAITAASNAEGFAATAATSSGVAASTLTDLQRALASASTVINGRASSVTLPYGTAHLGTVDAYVPIVSNSYYTDSDGVYVRRATTGANAAVALRAVVPSVDGNVYRVTARVKSSHAQTANLRCQWLAADGTSVTGAVYAATAMEADTLTTVTMIFGRVAGGLTTHNGGSQAQWNTATGLRFAVTAVNGIAASTLNVYDIQVDDLTQADTASRQATLAAGSASASANSATAAAVSANASAQSATAAQNHMLSANTARASAQTASQQAVTAAQNAEGFAASAGSSSGVAASTLTDLQRALASASTIISGRASTATLPYGASVLGTVENYIVHGAAGYGSDADGVYAVRSMTAANQALHLRALAPSADGRVYRLTARVKSGATNTFQFQVSWINADGTILAGLVVANHSLTADNITTMTAIVGRNSGGLVTHPTGTQATWDAAIGIRFGVRNLIAVSGGTWRLYDLQVEDITQADAATRQAEIASVSASSAVNSASIATSKATEAGNYASEALDYRNTSARLMSGGVSKNPIFNLWNAANTLPLEVSVGIGTGNTVSKLTTGVRYAAAVQIAGGGTVDGPYVRLARTVQGLDCSLSPPGVMVRAEIEYVSGNLAQSGAFLRAVWVDTTSRSVVRYMADQITATPGLVQVVEVFMPRPAAAVPGSATEFRVEVYATSTLGGATRAAATFRLHRLDFEEVLANSETSIYQKAVADLNGIQSGVVGLRASSGAANAALELVALSSPNGSTSTARIAANSILLDGTVRSQHLSANSVNATHIQVTSLSAISATIGILRTATSGERQEIHSDRILVYDANNIIRVRFGKLT